MKKSIYLAAIVYLNIASLTAQNCKYKTNDVDKFTGKMTKETKSEKVISSFYSNGEFSIKKVDTVHTIVFDYSLSAYSKNEPSNLIKGQQLQFLLENGEMVTIKSLDEIKGTRKTTVGIPPVYTCYLTSIAYSITKGQMEALVKSKVKSIRFYCTEPNGKETNIDSEIKKKNQEDIIDLVKCML